MKIRNANKFDFPQIVDVLKKFKKASPISLVDASENLDHVARLFTAMINGKGVVFVAEHEDKIVGMIMGIIDPLLWDPDILVMREIAYYVEEKHRGGTAGYRLLKAFTDYGTQLVEEGRIHVYSMSKLTTTPNIKYEKFGYVKVEEVWAGGVI